MITAAATFGQESTPLAGWGHVVASCRVQFFDQVGTATGQNWIGSLIICQPEAGRKWLIIQYQWAMIARAYFSGQHHVWTEARTGSIFLGLSRYAVSSLRRWQALDNLGGSN